MLGRSKLAIECKYEDGRVKIEHLLPDRGQWKTRCP